MEIFNHLLAVFKINQKCYKCFYISYWRLFIYETETNEAEAQYFMKNNA